MKAIPVLAALLVAVTTACVPGGASPSPRPSADVSPATTRPAASPDEEDQKAAQAAVLRLKDLGSSYEGRPYLRSRLATQDDEVLSRCLGRPLTSVHETARAFSSIFVSGDGRLVLAGVTFVDSRETAAADLQALQGPRAMPCLRRLLTTQLRRQRSGPLAVEVERIRPVPDLAQVVAYRFTVVVNEDGQDITQFIDLISATRGRAEVQASFQDVNVAVERAVEERAMLAMLNRLPARS
ncbi:hypothetical protein DQ384_12775 [Sphaerisporangium album]|uniref:Sensor domain-containing protein n=1 Tax=Sphaerisporangium album TaxID=509200 RepID=A0A367FKM0_9ACTN|nr:hypothetical protein [Sphaerisporangium album]RCG30844.1 hypothetical protein DQ384_12775 [Sphaerisporangium album]